MILYKTIFVIKINFIQDLVDLNIDLGECFIQIESFAKAKKVF